MPRSEPGAAWARLTRDRRAGFTLVEVLAALAVTGLFVAVVLPYAARLASHWWAGEAAVEAADGWMQAASRLGADLSEAVPYGLAGAGGEDASPLAAFSAGADSVAFVRPALGGGGGMAALETVVYEVRPSAAGQALVRRSRRFDPATFGREVGGSAATLLDGPYRLRLVEVATDGARRRGWAPTDGMPAAVELSAAPAGPTAGRALVPVAPVLLPIPSRQPAAARAGDAAAK